MKYTTVNSESLPFTADLTVRVTDLNYGNHLGHMEVVGLMHEARLQFLKAHGLSEFTVGGGIGLIMSAMEVRFLAEAHHGEEIKVKVGAEPKGTRGCRFLHVIHSVTKQREVAWGVMEFAFFDYKARKVAAAPESFSNLPLSLSIEK